MDKQRIEVRKKAEKFGELGEKLDTIYRKCWMEEVGNFNPMFCRYKNEICLVNSTEGDISDPFRREESYLNFLYIEV